MNDQKKQKLHYSGKKKCHTQKAQVIIDQATLEIIATAFGKGTTHDFKLFKANHAGIDLEIICLADSGYQGLAKLHRNSKTPKKKSKKRPLTAEEKERNRPLAQRRIFCEHVIGYQLAFENRIRQDVELPGLEPFSVWAARPEDVIVGKLMAWDEGHSQRHSYDIFEMLLFYYLGGLEADMIFDEAYINSRAKQISQEAQMMWEFLQTSAQEEASRN